MEIKENIKNYICYLQAKECNEMYFTAKPDKSYKRLSKRAAWLLFNPDIDLSALKFPLYYTTKEPKQWTMCKLGNHVFTDKETKNLYHLHGKALFQSAVRVTSQNVQLLVLLKTANLLREKAEAGGGDAAAAPEGEAKTNPATPTP